MRAERGNLRSNSSIAWSTANADGGHKAGLMPPVRHNMIHGMRAY
eukprot:COSAG06_NODE_9654_length_1841_cov_1.319635_3_plen_44_part_01